MKIVTIVGARPQFIKAAVVSRQIKIHNESAPENNRISEYIVHTGQHYDQNMSEVFFEEMEIPRPQFHLGIHQLSHGAMTGRMIEEIEKLLLIGRPDVVLVYGDTNSTLAGALAAVKLHIPVAHVEAGLRSYNRQMPEEHNRVLTDHVSTLLFCPTEKAVENLRREGIADYPDTQRQTPLPFSPPKIFLVGDVMYDAALFYTDRANESSEVAERIIKSNLNSSSYALVTIHRAENTDSANQLRSIIEALERISYELPVVWPIHPRTAGRIKEYGLHIPASGNRILTIEPVGYFDMIQLLRNSKLVLTDSGGLQKEAYFFAKPCVTLREETEWIELVQHGFARVSGTSTSDILDAFNEMINFKATFNTQLYGDGEAGKKIVSILVNHLR